MLTPTKFIEDLHNRASKHPYLSDLRRQEDVWNILTALRSFDGPIHDKGLKNFTTERVRGVVGLEDRHFSVRYEPLGKYEMLARDDLLYTADTHFALHYSRAVETIRRIYSYDLKEEKVIP